jgi:dTDP-glucose 4,6-dehydratase
MKLLVTGGAGFIGSNFIRYILKKYPEYEIINLDKLTYAGNLDNLKDIEGSERYEFVKGDVCDEKIVDEVVGRGVDAILNYAAESHVDRSITNPKDFIMTEFVGTFTLLEAAKKHGIKKYVQISTDEVYGSIDEGEFTEETPYAPNSPYSASKAGGDHLCRAYHVTYDMPVIVTHSCNVYGPYQYPEKIIPLFSTNILRGKKVPLYGDGKHVREWLYTEDHCRAVDVILHKAKGGDVYNIGSGYEITNVDLTNMVLDEFGVGDEAIEYVDDRLGHDRRYAIDFTKLKTELGWEPTYTFNEALTDTVKWYQDNEWWWKKLI